MIEQRLAYLAGFFDGEGCAVISSYEIKNSWT